MACMPRGNGLSCLGMRAAYPYGSGPRVTYAAALALPHEVVCGGIALEQFVESRLVRLHVLGSSMGSMDVRTKLHRKDSCGMERNVRPG